MKLKWNLPKFELCSKNALISKEHKIMCITILIQNRNENELIWSDLESY